jgi:hypothetical protein
MVNKKNSSGKPQLIRTVWIIYKGITGLPNLSVFRNDSAASTHSGKSSMQIS